MKKEFTSEIHTHNKHLTTQDYHSISECLQRGLNLTDTAKYIHCSVSTIKKIIDRNKILKYIRVRTVVERNWNAIDTTCVVIQTALINVQHVLPHMSLVTTSVKPSIKNLIVSS